MKLFVTKNRKREGALLKLLPLTKGLVICAVTATVGFGYVWQKNSIDKLGDEIIQRSQQLDALRKRNVVLIDQVATLKSPRVIENKCKYWNLGLSVPRESQIVRVQDPSLLPIPNGSMDPRPTVTAALSPRWIARGGVEN